MPAAGAGPLGDALQPAGAGPRVVGHEVAARRLVARLPATDVVAVGDPGSLAQTPATFVFAYHETRADEVPAFSTIDFLPLLRKGRKWIVEKRSVFGRSPTETLGSVEDPKMNEMNIPWYTVSWQFPDNS